VKNPITPALRARLPGQTAADEDYAPAFRRSAELLLNHATLFVGGAPHRLTEVEFYWAGPGHEDPFAHKDPIQVEFGRWYFHKQGGTYKGGTYKGLDIAAGRPGTFVGILLRGLVDAQTGELFDGSCTCMDHILARTGRGSVVELAGSFDGSIDPNEDDSSPLCLAEEDPAGGAKEVFSSPRVGLTLKKGATPERIRFLARPYRFSIDPARSRKGRPHLVVSLHAEGRSPAEIARITGVAPAHVGKYVRAYEGGKRRNPEEFRKDLSAEDLCALFGALATRR
jgi:hypothetical protein